MGAPGSSAGPTSQGSGLRSGISHSRVAARAPFGWYAERASPAGLRIRLGACYQSRRVARPRRCWLRCAAPERRPRAHVVGHPQPTIVVVAAAIVIVVGGGGGVALGLAVVRLRARRAGRVRRVSDLLGTGHAARTRLARRHLVDATRPAPETRPRGLRALDSRFSRS